MNIRNVALSQSGTEILFQLVYGYIVIIMFLLMTGYFSYSGHFSIVSYQHRLPHAGEAIPAIKYQ